MSQAQIGDDVFVAQHRWGRRPLSERQVQYAAMDALVSVLIFDFMETQSGPFREHGQQSLRGISEGFDDQSSTTGKQRHPTSAPDQRLPRAQPAHDISASRGSAHLAFDSSQRPRADGPAVAEHCLPISASSEVINPGPSYEGGSFLCGPGSVSMRNTTNSRDSSHIFRTKMPVQQMQKPSSQAPVSPAQSRLAGELPAVSPDIADAWCPAVTCWHRLCCLMSVALQIAPEAGAWTARVQEASDIAAFASCPALLCMAQM